jgi:hypothetical protein
MKSRSLSMPSSAASSTSTKVSLTLTKPALKLKQTNIKQSVSTKSSCGIGMLKWLSAPTSESNGTANLPLGRSPKMVVDLIDDDNENENENTEVMKSRQGKIITTSAVPVPIPLPVPVSLPAPYRYVPPVPEAPTERSFSANTDEKSFVESLALSKIAQTVTDEPEDSEELAIDRLIVARQKLVTDFIIAGGNMTAKSSECNIMALPLRHPRMLGPVHDVLLAHRYVQSTNLKYSVSLNQLPAARETIIRSLETDSQLQFASVAQHMNTVRSKAMITVIKFDHVGALVAVATADGLVSIYDFDECLFKRISSRRRSSSEKREAGREQQLSNAGNDVTAEQTTRITTLEPILSLAFRPGKAIADICWSGSNENELLVSYQRYPAIDLFDLSSRTMTPRLTCEIGREYTDGHLCLLFLKSTVTVSDGLKQQQQGMQTVHKLLAGSANGLIRCWELSLQRSKRVIWEMNVNTSTSGTAEKVSVIGLSRVSSEGQFVCATQVGTVHIFDLHKTMKAAFGGVSVPQQIHVFDVLGKEQGANTRVVGMVSSTFSQRRAGLPCGPLTVDVVPSRSEMKDHIRLTASNGDLYLVNIWSRVIYRWRSQQHTLSSAASSSAVKSIGADNAGFLTASELEIRRTFQACSAFGSIISTETMAFVSSQNILGQSIIRSVCLEKLPPLRGVPYGIPRTERDMQALVTTNNGMKKCVAMTCTLPGHVITGAPTAGVPETTMVVSEDLRNYLVASYLSSSSFFRSNEIFFSWSPAASEWWKPLHNKDDEGYMHNGQYLAKPKMQTGSYNSIAQVNSRSLVLKEPYSGPTVEHGSPKVRIRTNLVFAASPSPVEDETVGGGGSSRGGSGGTLPFMDSVSYLISSAAEPIPRPSSSALMSVDPMSGSKRTHAGHVVTETLPRQYPTNASKLTASMSTSRSQPVNGNTRAPSSLKPLPTASSSSSVSNFYSVPQFPPYYTQCTIQEADLTIPTRCICPLAIPLSPSCSGQDLGGAYTNAGSDYSAVFQAGITAMCVHPDTDMHHLLVGFDDGKLRLITVVESGPCSELAES